MNGCFDIFKIQAVNLTCRIRDIFMDKLMVYHISNGVYTMKNQKSKLPDESRSYWRDDISLPSFPTLEKDERADVAIVGAGLTGITAAYLLAKEGKQDRKSTRLNSSHVSIS